MTTIAELDALIKRVQGGDTGREVERSAFLALGFLRDATDDEYVVARNGDGSETIIYGDSLKISTDLTAVHALHKRVLPGWHWALATNGNSGFDAVLDKVAIFGTDLERSETANANTPAAAWLLAILKAKRAEMEAEAIDEENHRLELEEQQHQEEMRALENQEMDRHFREHPHG